MSVKVVQNIHFKYFPVSLYPPAPLSLETLEEIIGVKNWTMKNRKDDTLWHIALLLAKNAFNVCHVIKLYCNQLEMEAMSIESGASEEYWIDELRSSTFYWHSLWLSLQISGIFEIRTDGGNLSLNKAIGTGMDIDTNGGEMIIGSVYGGGKSNCINVLPVIPWPLFRYYCSHTGCAISVGTNSNNRCILYISLHS